MKKELKYVIIAVFAACFCSCNKDTVIDSVKNDIPIDSLYFSCKIDGVSIELKSPRSAFFSWQNSMQRLYKIKNGPKDSTIVSYTRGFDNDSLMIEIGFSSTVLADTTLLFPNTQENFKEQIYHTGFVPFQYLEPISDIRLIPNQNQGFFITIRYYESNQKYTSYKRFNPDRSLSSYTEFLKETSCVITDSRFLDNKIYTNARFINANFSCRLYPVANSAKTIYITDGKISGIF